MIDEYEATGERVSVGTGFRMGWSRSAWRFFLIDLLITVPLVLLFVVLFGMALLPLLGWVTGSDVVGIVGTLLTVGGFIFLGLMAAMVAIIIGLLQHFFWRAAALEGLRVFDAIRRGWELVRENPGDVALMWLLMFGIGIVWGILMIPVTVLLLLLALVFAGFPALLVGGIMALVVEGVWPLIIGGLIGLPLFILLVGVPTLFLTGLYEVFVSTTWTLTYRELLVLEELEGSELDPDLESEAEPELDIDMDTGGDEPTPTVEWDMAPRV